MISGSFAGSSIWLSIAGLEAKRSSVVWQQDGFAGLEFETPFNEAVLDGLLVAHRASAKTIANDLRELASRTRLLSMRADAAPDLLRFSRDCSVQALVQGLKLAEKSQTDVAGRKLTGSIIRRNVTDQELGAGFSFDRELRAEPLCICALEPAHPNSGWEFFSQNIRVSTPAPRQT
jgi:hypothetical protein